jgi:hypothetical protein
MAMFVAGCSGGTTTTPSTTTPSATDTETTEPATTDGTTAPAGGTTTQ